MSPSVLIDARLVLEQPTGIGQYVSSLLPALVSAAPEWHFHVLRRERPFPGYQLDQLSRPNMQHHTTDMPHMSLRQQFAVPSLARSLGVSLIHYPHFDAPVAWRPVPVVVTIHDAKYLVAQDLFPRFSIWKRLAMRIAYRLALARATAVIVDSEATLLDLRRLFPRLSPSLTVVHLAAAKEFRPPEQAELATKRLPPGSTRPYILSVGERRPHKNHINLVRAFASAECHQTHDLVIIGQPYKEYDAPERAARALGVEGSVRFLDGIGFADLITYMQQATVFVLVSYYEGFGLPVLEAMACGTPVITSRRSATLEVAGSAALLVEPDDIEELTSALDRVVADESLRARLSEQGAVRARSFTWEKAASETLAVYRSTLGRK